MRGAILAVLLGAGAASADWRGNPATPRGPTHPASPVNANPNPNPNPGGGGPGLRAGPIFALGYATFLVPASASLTGHAYSGVQGELGARFSLGPPLGHLTPTYRLFTAAGVTAGYEYSAHSQGGSIHLPSLGARIELLTARDQPLLWPTFRVWAFGAATAGLRESEPTGFGFRGGLGIGVSPLVMMLDDPKQAQSCGNCGNCNDPGTAILALVLLMPQAQIYYERLAVGSNVYSGWRVTLGIGI